MVDILKNLQCLKHNFTSVVYINDGLNVKKIWNDLFIPASLLKKVVFFKEPLSDLLHLPRMLSP